MDGPSSLQSNGLPFVFSSFTGQGLITDNDALNDGQVASIERGRLKDSYRDRMPLGDQVVTFGG